MQHYGTKAALFATAARLPSDDQRIATDHLLDVLDVRLGELPPETRALVRSMLTVPEAGASMREFLDERVENLARSFEGDDAELRALLVVSSILGLTIAQHFLKLTAFETVDRRALAEAAHALLSGPGTGLAPAGAPAGGAADGPAGGGGGSRPAGRGRGQAGSSSSRAHVPGSSAKGR
jgi:Tetracyclin repressor-like, C-terminal domain